METDTVIGGQVIGLALVLRVPGREAYERTTQQFTEISAAHVLATKNESLWVNMPFMASE